MMTQREFKKCNTCGEIKPLIDFYKRKNNRIDYQCKKCHIIAVCKYYKEPINRERQNKRKREKYFLNPEPVLMRTKKYREENIDKMKKAIKEWRLEHPYRVREINHKSYIKNRERVNERSKLAKRTDKYREKCRLREAKKRRTPKGRLNCCMSANIRQSLKGLKAGRQWETLVNFTVGQLKQHLEKLFTPEMTWENYGTYWHIDHKIPIAVFNYEKPEDIDFRLCWSLKNLQPLEKIENIKKKDKLEKPFQPSLKIAV